MKAIGDEDGDDKMVWIHDLPLIVEMVNVF
jgi:hypothetical protein